jgi:hypothetical protein
VNGAHEDEAMKAKIGRVFGFRNEQQIFSQPDKMKVCFAHHASGSQSSTWRNHVQASLPQMA